MDNSNWELETGSEAPGEDGGNVEVEGGRGGRGRFVIRVVVENQNEGNERIFRTALGENRYWVWIRGKIEIDGEGGKKTKRILKAGIQSEKNNIQFEARGRQKVERATETGETPRWMMDGGGRGRFCETKRNELRRTWASKLNEGGTKYEKKRGEESRIRKCSFCEAKKRICGARGWRANQGCFEKFDLAAVSNWNWN